MEKLILSLFIFLASIFVHAQAKVGRFTAGAMILYGTGSTGNDSDVLSRSMSHIPIALFAGVNFKKFRVGLNYEYDLIGQTAEPSEYANQNLGGKSTAPGVRLEFYDGKQAFGLIYRVSDQYTLDKTTPGGASSVYTGKSGYGIQYYRQIKRRYGIVLDYTLGEYKNSDGLSSDLKWNRAGLGIVFTNFASLK